MEKQERLFWHYKNTEFNVKFLEWSNLNQEIFFIFIFSAILSAYLYYLSNKNIIRAKCIIERFIRQEITDLTLKIKWEYYIKISQGDISKSIISEGQWGGILVAIPTAMPSEPLINRFGNSAGSNSGSLADPS